MHGSSGRFRGSAGGDAPYSLRFFVDFFPARKAQKWANTTSNEVQKMFLTKTTPVHKNSRSATAWNKIKSRWTNMNDSFIVYSKSEYTIELVESCPKCPSIKCPRTKCPFFFVLPYIYSERTKEWRTFRPRTFYRGTFVTWFKNSVEY